MPPHIINARFSSSISDREDSCRSDELDSIEGEEDAATTSTNGSSCSGTNSNNNPSNNNNATSVEYDDDLVVNDTNDEQCNDIMQTTSFDATTTARTHIRRKSDVLLSTQPQLNLHRRRRSFDDMTAFEALRSSTTIEEGFTMKNKGADALNRFALLGSSPPFRTYCDTNSSVSTDTIESEDDDDYNDEGIQPVEEEEEETVATSPPASGPASSTLSSPFRTTTPSATMLRSRLLNRLGIKGQTTMMMENVGKMNPTDPSLSILAKDVTSRSYTELLKGDYGKPDVHLIMKAKTKQLPSLAHVVKGGNLALNESSVQQQTTDEQRDPSVSTTSRDVAGSPTTVSSSLTTAAATTTTSNPHSIMMGRTGREKTNENPSNNIRFQVTVQVHTIPHRHAYSDRIRATLWTNPIEMQQNAARNSYEYAAEGWDYRTVADDEDMVIIATGEKIHPIHFLQQQQDQQQHNDDEQDVKQQQH